jgi:hypothetical protein
MKQNSIKCHITLTFAASEIKRDEKLKNEIVWDEVNE